jgi:hypothetical protein
MRARRLWIGGFIGLLALFRFGHLEAWLGRRAYGRLARSRFPVLHCTSASCTIGERAENATVPATQGE